MQEQCKQLFGTGHINNQMNFDHKFNGCDGVAMSKISNLAIKKQEQNMPNLEMCYTQLTCDMTKFRHVRYPCDPSLDELLKIV